MAKRDQPTVTEQTGKKWKSMQLAGFFTCLVAVLLFFVDGWAAAGILLLLLGLLVFCLGRIFAWWFHG